MSQVNVIRAIFQKQVVDSFRNRAVLLLFLLYPVVAIVMTNATRGQMGEMEQSVSFLAIFASMHCIFTPIVTTTSIIAEEKEKRTLRVLMTANVSPVQYLFSIGSFIFLSVVLSGSLFLLTETMEFDQIAPFFIVLAIGTIPSILVGMSTGMVAKNCASADGIAVPVAMVLGFLPMLASFNDKIRFIGKLTYGIYISDLIYDPTGITMRGMVTIIINVVLLTILFVILYRRNRMDEG